MKLAFEGSAFDGWVLGFIVSSTVVFATCRRQYEHELKLTKQLMMAQSKPVSAEELLAAEKEHVAKLTSAQNNEPSMPNKPL